jgi:cytochrome c oxidase subunit I+III
MDHKDVGLGLTLPLYVSGLASVGWWAMCITMLADLTAFVCLIFGYFFYWTARPDFPPDPTPGPGVLWPTIAAGLILGAWGLMLGARRWNKRNCRVAFYIGMLLAIGLAVAGAGAFLAGPWVTDLNPQSHVYAAIVWLLMIWVAFHAAIGVIMQLYCVARRVAGRMTARYNIEIANVVLYWHFTTLAAVVTAAVTAGFPLVA